MSYTNVQQSSLPFNEQITQQSITRKEETPPEDNGRNNAERAPTKHRRNYQACEPCRERKVKCDLGDVDNPTSGPCAKCSREKKHCWFQDKRKKDSNAGEVERAVKRPRIDSTDSKDARSAPSRASGDTHSFRYSSNPISPTRSVFSAESPPIPLSVQRPQANYTSHPARPTPTPFALPVNHSFPVQQSGMGKSYGNSTSSRTADGDDHVVIPQDKSLAESFNNTTDNLSVLVRAATSTEVNGDPEQVRQRQRALTGATREIRGPLPSRAQEARETALKHWSQMRFVRAGWFTADEALQYIEYFYTHLAPMTPVIIHDFRDPATHHTLLTEEPVLALAILSITSRYCRLESQAAVTRGYYIHEKLWDALRKIVQRLLWGQEQFCGGFCGAGMARTLESVTGQFTWKGSLRTLGTIEACLLLTDWQPRALHFPAGDDEDKLLGTNFSLLNDGASVQNDDSESLPYSAWLEPGWRSDRMSWMLLGLAQSLSFELGVFDTRHTSCGGKHGPNSACLTRRRTRRLVITYVSQISGRIGIQSSLSPEQDYDRNGPESNLPIDKMQKLWFEIASLMFDANRDIFPSREYSTKLIDSGQYKKEIAKFVPRLNDWFDLYTSVEQHLVPHMRHVLRTEFEYARLYINSLGLQRVVSQMAMQNRDSTRRGTSRELALVMQENQHYIDEVRAAAEQILKSSAHGLGDMKALGNAPVRTFLRSLSGMMFILKLFSLGAEEKVVRAEYKLLREMTHRMNDQNVDDVHLGLHMARLLQHIMDDVQRKMIRVPKPGSRAQSRQMTPQPNPAQQAQGTNSSDYAVFDSDSPDILGTIPMVDFTTQTFMPPPNFDPLATFDTAMDFDTNMDPALYTTNDDWISLPIDNLFNLDSNTATVNQGYGGIGPTFGDRDMLSLITGTHLDRNQGNPSMPQNFSNFGNGF